MCMVMDRKPKFLPPSPMSIFMIPNFSDIFISRASPEAPTSQYMIWW